MTTEPEPAGDNPGDSPEDLPEAEEVIDAADILGETSYEVDAGPVIPESPEGNVAETPEAIIPETEGATTLLPAEEEKPSPRKPRKPRTPKSAGKGAQAGDVIDLGADDIPDDEPTLFDLL